MSQTILEKLLKGAEVKWIRLGERLKRTTGTSMTAGKMKELHKSYGPLKIFGGGKTYALVNFNDIPAKDINKHPSIIVKSRGIIGFDYYDKPFSHKNELWSYHSEDNDICIKYIYYYMKTKEAYFQHLGNKMQMPQISIQDTDKFPVPLPPLSVQKEIVRILDAFTAHTAELTAELNERKKQYNYYRNSLMTFCDNEVEWKTLGEIAKVYDGTHQTPRYTDVGIPFVSVENIKNLYSTKKRISLVDFEKYKIKPQIDDVFMTRIGDIGTCALVNNDKPIAYYVTLALIRANKKVILPKYLIHTIESNYGKTELYRRTLVNAVPIKINLSEINKFRIPILPLTEQQRIIDILDKFDVLTTSITEGLPREIELRNKQYEYYRDQLLNFPKPENDAIKHNSTNR